MKLSFYRHIRRAAAFLTTFYYNETNNKAVFRYPLKMLVNLKLSFDSRVLGAFITSSKSCYVFFDIELNILLSSRFKKCTI